MTLLKRLQNLWLLSKAEVKTAGDSKRVILDFPTPEKIAVEKMATILKDDPIDLLSDEIDKLREENI